MSALCLSDFNIFRRAERDLQVHSLSGAVVSIVAFFVVSLVFVVQIVRFNSATISSELSIQQHPLQDFKLYFDLDVTIPCPLVDIDVFDARQTHNVDKLLQLNKTRLSSSFQIMVDGTDHFEVRHDQHDFGRHIDKKAGHLDFGTGVDPNLLDKTRDMVKQGEGCKLRGLVVVSKVPGCLKVSVNGARALFDQLYDHAVAVPESGEAKNVYGKSDDLVKDAFNTSHIIHRMNFYQLDADHTKPPRPLPEARSWLKKLLPVTVGNLVSSIGPQILPEAQDSTFYGNSPNISRRRWHYRFIARHHQHNPLDLSEKWMQEPHTSYQYNLQVVPVVMLDHKKEYKTILTESHYTIGLKSREIPSLTFHYSTQPIALLHKQSYPSLLMLFLESLSLMGGIYFTALLVDNFLDWMKILFKTNSGKAL